LSRFTVVVLCNLIFTPIVNYWFGVFTDNVKAINLLSQARIIKNVCLLPLESLILILFLGGLSIPLVRLGTIPETNKKIKFDAKTIVLLVSLTILAAAGLVLYYLYKTKG
jgi:hypothetical protein